MLELNDHFSLSLFNVIYEIVIRVGSNALDVSSRFKSVAFKLIHKMLPNERIRSFMLKSKQEHRDRVLINTMANKQHLENGTRIRK